MGQWWGRNYNDVFIYGGTTKQIVTGLDHGQISGCSSGAESIFPE